ncbi:MAG: sigma factor [Myxococcota bacterium]
MVDEFALLGAWRDGDSDAGSRLLRQYVDTLFHFFVGRVGEQAAEELTQATFEACSKSRERLQETGSIRAYLLAIARNKLLQHHDEWRRRGSRQEWVDQSFAAAGPSISSVVAGQEQQRLIVAALRRLPLDFQLAVELH